MSWPEFKFVWLTWIQVHLMEWVREVVATTLGVAPSGQLPPIIMQQEVPSIWDQIRKLSAILVSHTVCCQPALWRHLETNEGPRNGGLSRLIGCASHQSLASVQLITSILKKWQKRVLPAPSRFLASNADVLERCVVLAELCAPWQVYCCR